MTAVNSPLFCITSDVDWASDYALRDFLTLLSEYGVKATVFATHTTPVLTEFQRGGAIDVGIHPNFLPGSSQGHDVQSVLDRLCREFPEAISYRSHWFFDHTHITRELFRRGFRYDSNLCLYLQAGLGPQQHESGLIRFPVFWEDDVHWSKTGGDWNLDAYSAHFESPGLKVLSVHPFFVAANIPNQSYYQNVKHHITTLGAETIDGVRYKGDGVRTFLMRLLDRLSSRGERFYTLAEIYQMLPLGEPLALDHRTTGRQTPHSPEEFEKYWEMSDAERQQFVKRDFDQRNPKDPYATSRDYNARELEIDSIGRQLGKKGTVVDLGCGNGYTLISLARTLQGWEMVGVDFSETLIQGAWEMLAENTAELQSHPQFLCADAIEYLTRCDRASVDYLITERFVQNLPSLDVQRNVLRDAYRVLAPGGRLLLCEGSDDGFEALNDLRASVGLSRIPATSADNVSALRFRDDEIEAFARGVGFSLKEKIGYSTFFVIARVLYPLLIQPQAPRFDARINDLARQIQRNLPSQSGYGSNVLWVFEKPSGSAP